MHEARVKLTCDKNITLFFFRWQEAHEVIVKEIAPEAVIGQEYDYLHRYSAQKKH